MRRIDRRPMPSRIPVQVSALSRASVPPQAAMLISGTRPSGKLRFCEQTRTHAAPWPSNPEITEEEALQRNWHAFYI
jgi:hypothetical protein